MTDPGRAHEMLWGAVGLALGVVGAITILLREIFHCIALVRSSFDEYLGVGKQQPKVPARDSKRSHASEARALTLGDELQARSGHNDRESSHETSVREGGARGMPLPDRQPA